MSERTGIGFCPLMAAAITIASASLENTEEGRRIGKQMAELTDCRDNCALWLPGELRCGLTNPAPTKDQ